MQHGGESEWNELDPGMRSTNTYIKSKKHTKEDDHEKFVGLIIIIACPITLTSGTC